jgi:hypothetical protein
MNVFLFCGGVFALAFAAIWAVWFVEKLRGDSAPKLNEGRIPVTFVSRLSVVTAYVAFAFVGAIVLGVF